MRQNERRSTEHCHAPILGLPRFSVLGHPVTERFNMPCDRLGNVLPGDGTHARKAGFDLAKFVDGDIDTAMDCHAADSVAQPCDPLTAV